MRILARALIIGVAIGLTTLIHAQNFDLVIANGRVVDPESGLDQVRNIGISGRTIAAISADPLTGRAIIDAAGLVVAPGFIDLHAHGQTPETYRFQARDGVTTALELEVGTADIDRWYAERKSGRLINYGVSIGHIPVRMAVMRDPGSFLPTGDGAHKAASSARDQGNRPASRGWAEEGRRQHGRGFPLHAGRHSGRAPRSLSRRRPESRAGSRAHPARRGWAGGSAEARRPDESAAARRPHQQFRHHCDSRDAEDDRGRARTGTGRHDRGLSVRGGHDRNPIRESGRVPGCARANVSRCWNGREPASD